jgi:chemotaxis protein MotB
MEARINLDDLADQLEYESGEVKVKPPGTYSGTTGGVFDDCCGFSAGARRRSLRQYGDRAVVEGSFPTNWELSKARAAEIVRYLVEKGGMDSAKLSAVGYGASRPVASNGTEEGRKKNRRIEVVLDSPEEGTQAQSAKASLGESNPIPAEFTYNQLDTAPASTAVVPPASATQAGSASVDAPIAPAPSDVAVPVSPVGGETAPPPSGS